MVKINFEEDIRRFEFQGCSAKSLLDKIAEVYGLKNMAKFVLKYKDNEEDLVTISTDSELDFAVKHQLGSENLLRLDMNMKVSKKEKIAQKEQEEPQKPVSDPRAFREIWKERKMKWKEEKSKWKEQKKNLCREIKQMRKNPSLMKLRIPESGLKEGAVITLCSYADKKNTEGGMGWFLGVTEQGALVPNCAPGINAQWIVEEVKGAICLASAFNGAWHLRILDDGTVNAKGARGKYAQFIPEIHGDKICFRCVAHEGKKNKGGSTGWFVGVTPDGYIIGEADNNNFSQFSVNHVQQSSSGNTSA
jgi:hypothetical protein